MGNRTQKMGKRGDTSLHVAALGAGEFLYRTLEMGREKEAGKTPDCLFEAQHPETTLWGAELS